MAFAVLLACTYFLLCGNFNDEVLFIAATGLSTSDTYTNTSNILDLLVSLLVTNQYDIS